MALLVVVTTDVALGEVLGQASVEFEAVLFALVLYAVFSTPRRVFERRRMAQSKEAVLLSAVATVSTAVTGSRSRTMLFLRAKERELADALRVMRRCILTGEGVEEAVARSASCLSSPSAAEALTTAVLMRPAIPPEGGEEARGLASSAQLSQETKLPIFMTACFFSPILLLLYSVLAHLSSPQSLLEIVGLQLVLLDVAFYLCSGDRRQHG